MPSPSTGLALATSWRPAVGARWAASLESIMNTLRTELGGRRAGWRRLKSRLGTAGRGPRLGNDRRRSTPRSQQAQGAVAKGA